MLKKINFNFQRQKLFVYVVLIAATLAVYGQVHQFDFIGFDDDVYVTHNHQIQSGFTRDSVRWAFSTKPFGWDPLVFLSLMLDYQLFGFHAGGYHITNLILHILSAVLLFGLFCRMTGTVWQSAFVAAFFALHPLHVESVAWIAERKDVLSAFFWMLTLYLYVYYTEKPMVTRYGMVFCSFICALMSKPMVVTLPVIMVLLDYWPLRRFKLHKGNPVSWQLKEKTPFFVLSAMMITITVFNTNKILLYNLLPLKDRLLNAPLSFVTYIIKTFWPHHLAIFYPFPEQIAVGQLLGSALLLILISTFAVVMAKRLPFLFTGWFWFAITMTPVIGIIQIAVEPEAMADRYHYLPSIGIAVILAWGMPRLFQSGNIPKKILFTAGVALLALFALLTWQQCGTWKNTATIFHHTLRVTKNNYLAHNGLATHLAKEGSIREALDHYNKALFIKPDYVIALNNRGSIYGALGDYQKALKDFSDAIRFQPDYVPAYYNRGNLYKDLRQHQPALEDFNAMLRLNPECPLTYNDRGIVYGEIGRYQQAISDFSQSIRLNRHYSRAYNNRGFAYYKSGKYQLAVSDYSDAIRLQPDYIHAYVNRSTVYFEQREYHRACQDAQKACELGNCNALESAQERGHCSR